MIIYGLWSDRTGDSKGEPYIIAIFLTREEAEDESHEYYSPDGIWIEEHLIPVLKTERLN